MYQKIIDIIAKWTCRKCGAPVWCAEADLCDSCRN